MQPLKSTAVVKLFDVLTGSPSQTLLLSHPRHSSTIHTSHPSPPFRHEQPTLEETGSSSTILSSPRPAFSLSLSIYITKCMDMDECQHGQST